MALDQYGRTIHYLRISLTDQCNLRCRYCMTEHMTFRPREQLMQNHEIIRLARIFASLGFNKVRLTGGEPTLRHEIIPLVRDLAGIPGIRDIAMTTNGVLLKHLARPLRDAGLKRLNISIDTLDPVRFKHITRWGRFEDVWSGLMAAESEGFPLKINAVPVRGINDTDDVIALARLTLAHEWQVRFIEMMPFGETSEFQKDRVVTQAELMQTIESALGPLVPINDGKRWRSPLLQTGTGARRRGIHLLGQPTLLRRLQPRAAHGRRRVAFVPVARQGTAATAPAARRRRRSGAEADDRKCRVVQAVGSRIGRSNHSTKSPDVRNRRLRWHCRA